MICPTAGNTRLKDMGTLVHILEAQPASTEVQGKLTRGGPPMSVHRGNDSLEINNFEELLVSLCCERRLTHGAWLSFACYLQHR